MKYLILFLLLPTLCFGIETANEVSGADIIKDDMVIEDDSELTVIWFAQSNDNQLVGSIEIGLRSDGVMVWRRKQHEDKSD